MSEQQLTAAARRIRDRWNAAEGQTNGNRPQFLKPRRMEVHQEMIGPSKVTTTIGTYGGAEVSNTTADFLGDWRSVNSWHRFDRQRVRARSRQIERGNPWGKSFKSSLINNVIGFGGFKEKIEIANSTAFGDASDSGIDKGASALVKLARAEFDKPENFTTRKILSRSAFDRLWLSRLAFDGEVILRKIRGFDNDFKFTWQMIDPDYLDHNLNRIADNGNLIQEGIELDKTYKFPVAYYFLHRRINETIFNYNEFPMSRYYRVPAEEVFHSFVQDEDAEQVRGWPWMFAALVNLFRMGKYEEAALVNATIGASKQGFFKKTVPDGFVGDPSQLDDDGEIIDEVVPGSWTELPWNVEPVPWDPTYPAQEFDPFTKAMLRGSAAAVGMAYASLTGDMSDSNFSSSRMGQGEERENWMSIQQFMIDNWKRPEHEEFVYRALLVQKIKLPISKLDKAKQISFRGRRWPYIEPMKDWQAKQIALKMRAISLTQIIEENGGDRDEVLDQIEQDEKDLKAHGIVQILDGAPPPPDEDTDEVVKPVKKVDKKV